jgi:ABC-2 type transport system ATP-binding protein
VSIAAEPRAASPAGDAALTAVGVSKRFSDRVALDGVGLAVEPGEVHGLLGPNGAGKTTLLRVLLGLVLPDSGQVWLLGAPAPEFGGALPVGVAGLRSTRT